MRNLVALLAAGTLLAGCASDPYPRDRSYGRDALLGGALGAAAGAAVGNAVGGKTSTVVGGALGAAVGAAIATEPYRRYDGYERYDSGYASPRYRSYGGYGYDDPSARGSYHDSDYGYRSYRSGWGY
ncbi:MAG: glycine zipper 2TM domain-containing protein [Gammaproteobacteria bacterium]|jgi:hypothetical protein|nr:glycine zipper 2TM domain-containing protein [Gammaproteobacteria bacterium]